MFSWNNAQRDAQRDAPLVGMYKTPMRTFSLLAMHDVCQWLLECGIFRRDLASKALSLPAEDTRQPYELGFLQDSY